MLSGVYVARITKARAAAQGAPAAPPGAPDNDAPPKANGPEKHREPYRLATVAQSNADPQSSGVPDTGARQPRRYKSDEQGAADEKEAEAERKEAPAATQRKRVQFREPTTPNDRATTTAKQRRLRLRALPRRLQRP